MTSAPPTGSAPARSLSGTEPFFIVLNTGSGREDAHTTRDTIARILDEGGRRHQIIAVERGADLPRAAREALELARAQDGVVVAAGGDGTLNAVASVVLGSGVPFGILPQGTFNFFGRAYGISQDTEVSTRALLQAQIEPVQVGMLNGRLFLVNASLGLYPQLLEDREAYKQRYGRSRLVALWSGLVTLFRPHRQLRITLTQNGVERQLRTPTVVVGNNTLQLQRIGIPEAEATQQGQLVAMTVRPVGTLALYGLLVSGLFSRLGEADQVISFAFDKLGIGLGRRVRRVKVAMDGEISWMQTPLMFEVAADRLPLLVPPPELRLEPA
ncbi:diacylglycerol kinase [Bordetella genomosp. 1]|uniref:Diacylglycerol kinase n=1 Tax=Bordetella genomosp. 1 TaxID=1395607 RepID=A0A261SP56_9BORD|nr:diacylglycerol kinase family protein [Bordetella genomosp. 1]OZI39168.1 diacylglycerol kinase [Bordetella genomosp. 1]OZI65391.1 diacylglycerol kinase [Bordetella genomosp. 1]